MGSNLFDLAASTVRRAAVEQFRRSTYGQLVNEVGNASKLPQRVQPEAFGRLVDKYQHRVRPEQLAREVTGLDFGKFVRQVERYAKGGGAEQAIVGQLLKQWGPAGQLIKSLIGSGALGKGSLQRELDAATKLLESFGHLVIPPKGSPTVGQMRQGAEGLIDYLETQGYEVKKRIPQAPAEEEELPEGGKVLPFGISPKTASGQPRQVVDLPGDDGTVRVRVDDPLVTGEFISVDSSNVHSIAYDVENALLYVRYLAPAGPDEERTQPGSLYQYRNISPLQFQQFQRASSKGRWVWDNLRIRGTVSGHRTSWALVGIMNGYVPRQATYMGGGQEWYIRRKLYMGKGRWAQSQLADAPAALSQHLPKTGAPKPPNSGRPRR